MKYQQKRGTGVGKDYKPWIQVGEFGSSGTASCPIDWKNGRTMQLLSQAEAMVYHLLRYNDVVVDIREQYPLDIKETLTIAKQLGVNHPFYNKKPTVMTTDLLATLTDGSYLAVSVKATSDEFEKLKTKKKCSIEQAYWLSKGAKYVQIAKDQLNPILYDNIRTCVAFYDEKYICDKHSIVKHLIAHHLLDVDISKEHLDYEELTIKFRKEIEQWQTLKLETKSKSVKLPGECYRLLMG